MEDSHSILDILPTYCVDIITKNGIVQEKECENHNDHLGWSSLAWKLCDYHLRLFFYGGLEVNAPYTEAGISKVLK